MVYDAFKQVILIVVITVFCISNSTGQNKIKDFSTEYDVYLKELSDLMLSSDNSDLKSNYKKFKKISSENYFSDSNKNKIISISRKMLKKRYKPSSHFNNFLLNLIAQNQKLYSTNKVNDWLDVVSRLVDDYSSKKLLVYFYFSLDLINEQVLRETKTTKWTISADNYDFLFDNIGPLISFSNIDLTCESDGSEIVAFGTNGKYYPFTYKLIGNGGKMNWSQKGLSSDSVFVNLKKYTLDVRNTTLKADSVTFTNKLMFDFTLEGSFIDKITRGKQAENYPKFVSFSKGITIKNIYPQVDYQGGYKLQGNSFIADGGKYADAKLIFNNNGKKIFVANANKFNLGGEVISSKQVGIKIYFDSDSLYHSNLKFNYDNNKRKLKLSKSGKFSSPMLNTYHQLNMKFELLEWEIDKNIITFGSLPGTSVSQVSFESVDMYLENRFDELQGIDAVHPLILIDNYMKNKKESIFFVEDFARYMKFPFLQVQTYLIDLANKGFLFYDFSEDRVTVLPSLSRYVDAKSQQGDYDVIQFNSKVIGNSLAMVNAALNIETKDLVIRGINQIAVSDSQKVAIFPRGGEVKILKNRDFIFNGRVFAGNGRVNLYGEEFHFKYDDFKIDLKKIDSIQLSVPLKPLKVDMYNNPLLTSIKTVIEAVSGELVIDDSSNKSGLRKGDFPQFPIFKSFNDSYVYYDDPSIFNGVYNRSNFSFHLKPFTIDSLESYSTDGLWFAGTFKSSDIFPVFDDTLRIQSDYSLGFTRETPKDGFPLYSGKSRYYNEIELGNNGLRGKGKFEYLTSTIYSEDIIFYPDSTQLLSNALTIDEVTDGIEFPQVSNTKTYCNYLPYSERLEVFQTHDLFALYNQKARLQGNLLLKPVGLTGKGIMKLDLAEVASNFFSFNSTWFKADTANLSVFDDSEKLAFSAKNLRANIDLSDREGMFFSNGLGSYVNFPASEYICYIDQLKWEMDKEQLTFGNKDVLSKSRSQFISTNKNQDSLSFYAKSADYSLRDYVINASGVDSIAIADAIIYPDSAKLIVSRNAEIQTLKNSKLLLDTLVRYHEFDNATVDIFGKNNYEASGDYIYIDALKNKQPIFFSEIVVNEDTISVASGNVNQTQEFKIGSRYDYYGDIKLIGDRKDLKFTGYFKLSHNCSTFLKEWISFSSFIDPNNIYFTFEKELYSNNDDKLYSGIYYNRDSSMYYSTFLSTKKRAKDVEFFSAASNVYYNDKLNAYIVGGIDSSSNYLILDDKTCEVSGSGELDLNFNLGRINSYSVGDIYNKDGKIGFNGFLFLDFDFAEKALEIMATDIFSAPGDEIFDYDKKYENNLGILLGNEAKEELMIDLEINDAFEKLPKKMNKTFALTKLNFEWDSKNESFISRNNIGVGNIGETQINGMLNGHLLIEKGRNSDILTLYLQTEFYDEYYFTYKSGVMRAISTNPEFNAAIVDVKDTKRKSKSIQGLDPFRYMLANEDSPEKFLKKIKKKF